MRNSDSLLPTSSVEMKTDRFISYSHYAKAGLIFATTTATYFLAKATGVLPNWFGNSETSSHSESMDTTLIVSESSSLVTSDVQPEVAVFSKIFAPTSILAESSLTDFQEADLPSPVLADSVNEMESEDEIIIDTALIKSSQRRLLQQTSAVTIVNPISDRVIDVNQPYEYPLGEVFSGGYTSLGATQTNGSPLPDWLRLEYALLGSYNTSAARSVVVAGNTVFVTDDGAGLLIVDVSMPSAPRLLGSYLPPVLANNYNIAISGSTVFMTGGQRLQIIDVSTPSAPRLLSSYFAQGQGAIGGVVVSGSMVFMTVNFIGFQIVDVSTPSSPQLLGSYNPPGFTSAYDIAVSGSTVFMTDYSGLEIVDVRIPSAPSLLGSYALFSSISASGLTVSGNTVFFAYGGILQIVDVSTPTMPRLLRNYNPPNDNLPSIPRSMVALGNTLFAVYAVDQSSGLLIVMDVSTPSVPRLLGRYNTPSIPYRVAVSGNMVFVANSQAGLQIIDSHQGKLTGITPSSSQGPLALTISVGNTTGILANTSFTLTVDQVPYLLQTAVSDQSVFPDGRLSLQLSSHLFVHDGSFLHLSVQLQNGQKPDWLMLSLFSPAIIGRYSISAFAYGITISGGILFAAYPGVGLQILDISTPSTPHLLGQYSAAFSLDPALDVAVLGSTAFVANGDGGLQILDVSTPSAPRLLGSYDTPDNAGRVVVSGSTVFVADGNSGLQILDVSTPSAPRLLGSYNTPGYAYDLAISGSTVFVADYNAGLMIVDVSTPSAPSLLGSYDTPGTAYGVAVSGSTVFVADGEAGLQIVDVSNTSLPRLLGNYDTPGGLAYRLVFSSNTIFIADKNLGLQIVDVSIPSSPRLLGSDTVGSALDMALLGDKVFVSILSTGLLLFDVSQWQLTATPHITDVDNYAVQLIATDAWGAQASINFPLMVEYFPKRGQPLEVPLAGVGLSLNWVISPDTFTDADNDILSYSANQADGSPLPNWLTFNPRSLVFLGVPQATDVRTWGLQLSAQDPDGARIQETFNLTVSYFPEAKGTITKQLADVDQFYQYTVSTDTFSQEDKAVLVYSAQQSSGSSVPDWLSFNSTSRQLKGTPNITALGDYDLQIVATNSWGAQASIHFPLIVEHFPEVARSIISPLADINSVFRFSVPADSFIDRDGDLLTYSAQRENTGSLPNWLAFNPQSLSFSGVPLETDKGDLPLQLTATDPAGATATTNLTIQVIHFPVLAHPQSAMTIRSGRSFNFSLPPDTFADVDQVGLTYGIKPSLPSWLSFDNRSLSFSGQTSPPGTTALSLVATDQRGAEVRMDFQLVARGEVPPTVLASTLSNQAATVGRAFSYFPPQPLFADAYNNTLIYSASQQDGSALPLWLNFDNDTFHFSGTPGRGDTNFYAIRTVGVKIVAQSPEGQASTNFNIMVDGVSWGQLAINIGAPVVSVLTTLYALYEARALLLNRCRHEKHTNAHKIVHVGQNFRYEFKSDKIKSIEQIYRVQAGIHDSARRCYEFSKPTYRLLPGGDLLPWWMEYNADSNLLYSKGVVPSELRHTKLEIQAEDEDGIILDKFILDIMPALKLEKTKEEKHEDQGEEQKAPELTSTATVAEGGGIELELTTYSEPEAQSPTTATPLIGSKKTSERDLQESKKESPSLSTRRTKVPSVTNLLAPDSPLRQGTRTTSSMIAGDSRKKQTGKQTDEPQVDRQSRTCC